MLQILPVLKKDRVWGPAPIPFLIIVKRCCIFVHFNLAYCLCSETFKGLLLDTINVLNNLHNIKPFCKISKHCTQTWQNPIGLKQDSKR